MTRKPRVLSEERYCVDCVPRDVQGNPLMHGHTPVLKHTNRCYARVCAGCRKRVRDYYVLAQRDKRKMDLVNAPAILLTQNDDVFYYRSMQSLNLKGHKVG